MKILDLPIKAKWYDMIESGEKKEEYRECKKYWVKRLMCHGIGYNWIISFKPYTHVRFHYGYTKRIMLFELKEIVIGKGNPAWGAPDHEVFILKLGKREK